MSVTREQSGIISNNIMQIRPATPADTPAIISLLRKSLGESTIPKSEALWSWKHENNPFGNSYVLLAEENQELIGVRAFMRWDWKRKGILYKTVRAVDTATHPKHQGKGIFKKLTLQQAEICKTDGIQFIYNTPNEQSAPGYLKMGWKEQNKMALKVKILKPFSICYSKFINKKRYYDESIDPTPFQKWTSNIFQLLENPALPALRLTTAVSPSYISWRYANNPLYRYNYFTDEENALLICRIKEHTFGRELRLVDFFDRDLNSRSRKNNSRKLVRKAVAQYCREHNISFISLGGMQYEVYKYFLSWMGWIPQRNIGPLITLRDLNMNDKFPFLLETRYWNYSIGDLELF